MEGALDAIGAAEAAPVAPTHRDGRNIFLEHMGFTAAHVAVVGVDMVGLGGARAGQACRSSKMRRLRECAAFQIGSLAR